MVGYGDLSWINPEKNPKSNLQPWVHASVTPYLNTKSMVLYTSPKLLLVTVLCVCTILRYYIHVLTKLLLLLILLKFVVLYVGWVGWKNISVTVKFYVLQDALDY